MVFPACQAQDQGTALDVDDLGVEELGDIGQFFGVCGVGLWTLIIASS